MKLTDGIKLSGNPVEIPDCSRDELPQFFCEMGFKTGAEIGVYKGAFTEKFCKAGLTMYAIDPWESNEEIASQARQDFLYGHTQRTLSPYKNCTIIRKRSVDAAGDFKDGSLDFVYIDGNHKFKYIAEDLYFWFPKVKKGGVVSGHDYFFTGPDSGDVFIHVKPVVDAFTKAYNITDLFMFGKMSRSKMKTNADKHFSWMFFKP